MITFEISHWYEVQARYLRGAPWFFGYDVIVRPSVPPFLQLFMKANARNLAPLEPTFFGGKWNGLDPPFFGGKFFGQRTALHY